jgi:hypothetical protein
LDNLGIIKKPCGAHRQLPGPNHGPTASGPHRPPSNSRRHCLTASMTSRPPPRRPPPRRPPFPPPRPPPLAAIKGAQPPMNDLFFLLRPSPPLRRCFVIVEPPHNAAPVPLRTTSDHLELRTDVGSSLGCSSAPPPPVPHQPQQPPWTALVSPPLTPLLPQISPLVLLRALAAGPTNLVAGRCRNSVEPPSTGAMGASSPALGLRPTSHVGWAVAS